MASRTLRAAIVGASTLLGKELAEQLNESAAAVWDMSLLDDEDAIGQMTRGGRRSAGDSAAHAGRFRAAWMWCFLPAMRETTRAALEGGAGELARALSI